MGRIRITVGALALVVVACSPTGPDAAERVPSPKPTTTQPTLSAEDPSGRGLDVIVLPVDGDLPPDLIVGCPNGPAFPFGSLAGIEAVSEDDPDGFLLALEPFLQSEEGEFWPQEGWKLLSRDAKEVTLVAVTEDGSLAFMDLDRGTDSWRWSGASMSGERCELQFQVPRDLNTVDWSLDPSLPDPTSESTVIHVLLTERECVSGLPIGERLVGPQVVMTDTELHMAFAATPPPGEAQTCQGNPTTHHEIALPGPLGDREIVTSMSIGHSLEDYLGD